MFKVLKGLIVFFVLFVYSYSLQVYAANAYFVWEKTIIDVPINSSLDEYKNKYELSFYVDGKKSNEYSVEMEVNASTFSTVLTQKIGKYTVYYKARSEKYYVYSTQAIIFNVIDITQPKVLLKNNIIKIPYGGAIDIDKNFIISDDTTARENMKILLEDSEVLYNMVGVYDCSLFVYDEFQNETKIDFKVEVMDTVKPQLLVQKPLILSFGEKFNKEEYFIATDNCNGDLTKLIKIEGLDLKQLGHQKVTISVSDYSNNKTSIVVDVVIIDDIKPSVLLKRKEIELDIVDFEMYDFNFFKNYIIEYADNCTLKESLIVEIDFSSLKKEVFDYIVTYRIFDENNNYCEESLIVKVREMVGPNLIGEDEININIYEEIDLFSLVSVEDPYDFEAIKRLEILENNLDNSKVGKYNVKYICYNNSGRFTEKTITINVIDVENENNIGEKQPKNNIFDGEIITIVIISFLVIIIIVLLIRRPRED